MKNMTNNHKKTIDDYCDMLDLPRPVIRGRAPMSRESRAAQFSPFAALTGYDKMIEEGIRSVEEEQKKM